MILKMIDTGGLIRVKEKFTYFSEILLPTLALARSDEVEAMRVSEKYKNFSLTLIAPLSAHASCSLNSLRFLNP